ncbi:MAG: glycosyltransferase, partial [Gemmatimonadetes bacterium]|nr:glycosyltransferase [Gemmatimonadota bacterium]
MPRLSIVFLIRSLDIGGAQRQLVTLARGLHRRGHAVLVVTFYDGGPLVEELRQEGVPLAALGKRSRWDLAGPLWRAARCIRRVRPDVVHGYLADANIFATVLARLAPPARAVWGVRASGLDLGRYPWGVRTLFRLSAFAARSADLIIGNSESGRADHVAAGYPAGRFTVIPNGIDTMVFRPDTTARAAARQAFGLAPDARVIGLVGRIDPMKGHAVFVDAAALLAAERGDVQFLCVG